MVEASDALAETIFVDRQLLAAPEFTRFEFIREQSKQDRIDPSSSSLPRRFQ